MAPSKKILKAYNVPTGYAMHIVVENDRMNATPSVELVLLSDQFKYGLHLPFSKEVKSI